MADRLFDISGKQALITGSSRGLGNALARGLAERGVRVTLHGRSRQTLAAAANELRTATGADVDWVSFDVADAGAVRDGVETLVKRRGPPDILVNNAGLQRRAPFTEFAPADWDAVIATNLSGVFYVASAVAGAMSRRGSGKIVNIGSVQSMLARAHIAPYAASKGGVAMLTRGMAAELAPANVQVNCISPGYFQTDINSSLWQDPDFNAWLKQRTPAGRWGRPDELVGTLIYLCAEASSFVTGQNIFVDGGLTSVV